MAESHMSAYQHPYGSRRTVVYGCRGMVATTHPLAAHAGLRVLQQGGNAIDAAVAAAASLTVVEPTSNGIGSDAFAIVWTLGQLFGLNSSGPAPRGLTREWVRRQGLDIIQPFGWSPVTVPGAPAAWVALSERFGRISLSDSLAPAVELGRAGHPVAPTVAIGWSNAVTRFQTLLTGSEFAEWFRVFAKNGRGPYPGEVWYLTDHAATLEAIGATGGRSFYEGDIAERIAAYARATGGVMMVEDLAAFQPEWVVPLSVRYRGHDIWELPPNGQGLVALTALQILEGLAAGSEAERIHYQIEALKLGFADAAAYVADPRYMPWPADTFLSPAYAAERRALISDRAAIPTAGVPVPGGTVYLCTADGEGNMVSFIQSNYRGFGSGLVIPGTGIALQNRGELFTLDANHPNSLEPGKRPFHTIIPGFVTRDGKPLGPFGVMGGFMQPQGHVQVMSRVLDDQLNPQAALDAPRFYWREGNRVAVEAAMPDNIVEELRRRGHEVDIEPLSGGFGRGQIIWRDDDGVLAGGTEPRADGHVAVW